MVACDGTCREANRTGEICYVSGGFKCGVNLAVLFQPFHIAALRLGFHLTEKLNDFRTITGLGWIFVEDNGIYFDRDDVFLSSHQSRPPNLLAWKFHTLTGQKNGRSQVWRHWLPQGATRLL